MDDVKNPMVKLYFNGHDRGHQDDVNEHPWPSNPEPRDVGESGIFGVKALESKSKKALQRVCHGAWASIFRVRQLNCMCQVL